MPLPSHESFALFQYLRFIYGENNEVFVIARDSLMIAQIVDVLVFSFCFLKLSLAGDLRRRIK